MDDSSRPGWWNEIAAEGLSSVEDPVPDLTPFSKILTGDARQLPVDKHSVDLIVTSPPYWKKRDYGYEGQIGQEPSPNDYVESLATCFDEWARVLVPSGSVFLNIGDTFHARKLAAIPARVEVMAVERGWIVRNRIIWAKEGGMPEPARDRLANRHEYIIHFVRSRNYYYDLLGYSQRFGNGANPGDIWTMKLGRNTDGHLAPYPDELVERAIALACPCAACSKCGAPRRRITERTAVLDASRPQARRAMEIAAQHGLTLEHIRAVQATGISDAGKALRVQNGTGRNSDIVKALAAEAKAVLKGYFREFTFAKRRTTGWSTCDCGEPTRPGIVLDPFMGTGTTARVALAAGRSAIGIDLDPSYSLHLTS